MEGKFLRSLFANRFDIVIVLFIIFSLIAAGILLLFLFKAPFVSSFMVEKKDGAFVITERKQDVSITLPGVFTEWPHQATYDFYTKEKECRISILENTMGENETLASWIEGDKEQLASLTVLHRNIHFIDSEHRRALYTVYTAETGKSVIYYEEKHGYILEIRAYAEDPFSACYLAFEKQFIQ